VLNLLGGPRHREPVALTGASFQVLFDRQFRKSNCGRLIVCSPDLRAHIIKADDPLPASRISGLNNVVLKSLVLHFPPPI
jgi:hypothetical protein